MVPRTKASQDTISGASYHNENSNVTGCVEALNTNDYFVTKACEWQKEKLTEL